MVDSSGKERAGTVRALAAALGVSKSMAGKLSATPWWPEKGAAGWDVAKCREAYDRHVNRRSAGSGPPAFPASPSVRFEPQAHGGALQRNAGVRLDPVERAAQLAALRLVGASPVEIARAGLDAARLALAGALESEAGAGRGDFDSFAATLAGLRQAEAAYLELERERGELIPRTAARACMGGLARRMALALERLEARAAAQIELWLADEKLRALPVEERDRLVRAWVRAQTRQGRAEETAELEALIAAEVAAKERAR